MLPACGRLRLKCDGTRAETRFRLSAKRTSQFKSAGASVQSTTGSRYVRISGSNAGYTMFRGSVKSTGYPLHSPVFPSLPLPCVTVCHHISTGLYRELSYFFFLILHNETWLSVINLSPPQNKIWVSTYAGTFNDIIESSRRCFVTENISVVRYCTSKFGSIYQFLQ